MKDSPLDLVSLDFLDEYGPWSFFGFDVQVNGPAHSRLGNNLPVFARKAGEQPIEEVVTVFPDVTP